jgi:hypothetical protein
MVSVASDEVYDDDDYDEPYYQVRSVVSRSETAENRSDGISETFLNVFL